MDPPKPDQKGKRLSSTGRFEKVKDAADLRAYAEAHLVRMGRTFVCPHCSSGTGPDKSPAFSITPDGAHWKCFSCHAGGDVFDLAGELLDTDNKLEQLEEVARFFNVQIESDGRRGETVRAVTAKDAKQAQEEKPKDYREGRARHAEYVRRCQERITQYPEALAYLEKRGLDLSEGYGYDPSRRRLVIPWKGCDWYHIDRDITDAAEVKYLKPRSDEVGPQPFYNPDALKEPVFFIVEGVLDAIALEALGYPAVAVASNRISAANAEELAQAVERSSSDPMAVIMLDNDVAGRDGAEVIRDTLDAHKIKNFIAFDDPDGGSDKYKDADQWRREDPKGLREYLYFANTAAHASVEVRREKEYRATLERFKVRSSEAVAYGILEGEYSHERVSTGFESLDRALGGGLPQGLVALGAVSSMGKTTIVVQMADHIASTGRPVLIVTIEQSAAELVSKSLARIANEQTGGCSITGAALTDLDRRMSWSAETQNAAADALNRYVETIAPNLSIQEGKDQPSAADIRSAAEVIKARRGVAPVIFIDYLQLLAPISQRGSDKQTVDENVMALRQMARDLSTTVFVVSSLNRSSYSGTVSMESFKESGAIEYGADVLLGLEPAGVRDAVRKARGADDAKRKADKVLEECKDAFVRDTALYILKNRNGSTPRKGVALSFHTLESRFVDPGQYAGEAEESKSEKVRRL